jgi:ribosome-binding factor A
MPGDPKECRQHARRCAELASIATTPEARDQFLSLQMSWIRLAADLEQAKAFIDAMNEMDEEPPKAAE